jgi:AraC family transcriptional regulator of adaptative response/methylated-DNA-[protein]-cysteine methyltransferase
MPNPGAAPFRRTAEAIRFLRRNAADQPDLPTLAAHLGVAPAVAQREFRRLVGISPKRFLQDLTCRRATGLLDRGRDLLTTSLEAGLSGPSRLHDHLVRIEAMSPGEWKDRGEGQTLILGEGDTPFGRALLAQSARGIHRLEFLDGPEDRRRCDENLRRRWAQARRREDDRLVQSVLDRIFRSPGASFRLALVATPFQVAVWKALLRLPAGRTCSYQRLATSAGHPPAIRAVANAVAANPVAVLIPCHRVLAEDGALCGYRWGIARKLGLLAQEEP